MSQTPRQFLREINIVTFLFLITTGVLCIVYGHNRGNVQLTFTVNNTQIKTTQNSFSIGSVYGLMLGLSALHHLLLAIWPDRTIRYLRRKSHIDRWIAFSLVFPMSNIATLVGIAEVTDVFAVYAAASISIVLLSSLWISTQESIWKVTRFIVVLLALCLFFTYWYFVWAETVRFGNPLLMYTMGSVVIFAASLGMWNQMKRALTREAILINVTTGIQIGCAGIWSVMHSGSTSKGLLSVLFGVVLFFVVLSVYLILRISGTFIEAVNDADIEIELEEELLPRKKEHSESDDNEVFGPSLEVAQILADNDDSVYDSEDNASATTL